MSETWKATKTAWERLRTALAEADEETRAGFWLWLIGLSVMGSAIIAEFGWCGSLFVAGFVLWATNKPEGRV